MVVPSPQLLRAIRDFAGTYAVPGGGWPSRVADEISPLPAARGDGSRQPMSDPAPSVTSMTEDDAGDRLARLLLPYRRRGSEDADGPDHRVGWWFTDAPPGVTREALRLVDTTGARRPNDQPPEEWLVAQAECRDGMLAGFVVPAGPASPRMRIDAIIVPCSQAEDLADQIALQWPVDGYGTALDLAVVEGFASRSAEGPVWAATGYEFCPWRVSTQDWLGAAFCSFWWD